MISIIIPTYNNIQYLKILLSSIKKNSVYNHEIILHVNEGTDGTLDFVKNQKIKHTYTKNNVGLCTAINLAAAEATTKYLLYSHDDMYFCPEWDVSLLNEIKEIKHDNFFLSGTLIEAYTGHIVFNCGDKFNNFDENKLLKNYKLKNFYNYQGSHYAPHLVSKRVWEKVGGFSEEFNPGVASDPDFNMKLWQEGVRIFKGINDFKVYHFVSIVTKRLNDPITRKINLKSRGNKIFLLKWGISVKFFKRFYLKTNSKFISPLTEPKKNVIYLFNFFLCKINYIYIKIFYNKLYCKN